MKKSIGIILLSGMLALTACSSSVTTGSQLSSTGVSQPSSNPSGQKVQINTFSVPTSSAQASGAPSIPSLPCSDSPIVPQTGDVGPFFPQGQLPVGLRDPSTVTATIHGQTYVYLFGGRDANLGPNATIYRATMDRQGTLGSLSVQGTVSQPWFMEWQDANLVMLQGQAYVFGTFGDYAHPTSHGPTQGVYRATIDAQGNLGSVTAVAPGVVGSTVVAQVGSKTFLVLFDIGLTGEIDEAEILPNGNLGTMTQIGTASFEYTNLARAFSKTFSGHTYIYITRWPTRIPLKAALYRAEIDSQGAISPWSIASPTIAQLFAGHQIVTADINGTSYVYIIGGYYNFNVNPYANDYVESHVMKAAFDTQGIVGQFTTMTRKYQCGQQQLTFGALPCGEEEMGAAIVPFGQSLTLYILSGLTWKCGNQTPIASFTPNVYRARIY